MPRCGVRSSRTRSRGSALLGGSLLACLVGCGGDGEDIGPNLPVLPDASYVVSVADSEGLPVCNAQVLLAGREGFTDRDGRVDLDFQPLGGSLTVEVRTATATSAAAELLGGLRTSILDSEFDEPGRIVHLPRTTASFAVDVVAGVPLPAPLTLDDAATSGAVVRFPAGTRFDLGGAARARFASGSLRPDRAPPLRTADGARWIAERVVVFDPPQLIAAPAGGDLQLPNDLGLAPGATCNVLGTDPVTGDYRVVGQAVASADGATLEAAGVVAAGGAYACVLPAGPETTTVVGRIIQPPERDFRGGLVDPPGQPVPQTDVLVRIGGVTGSVDAFGQFRLEGVPAIDPVRGGPRMLVLEYAGNRFRWPLREATQPFAAVPGGEVDLEDLVLDAPGAGRLRLMPIERGRTLPQLRLEFAHGELGFQFTTTMDADGIATVPAVPFGIIGLLRGRPSTRRAAEIALLDQPRLALLGRREIGGRVFVSESQWLPGGNVAAVAVLDALGGGRVQNAELWVRAEGEAADRSVGATDPSLPTRIELRRGELTATRVARNRAGQFSYSAFTVFTDPTSSLELTVERIAEPLPWVFDEHARARGTVPGAAAGEPRVVAASLTSPEVWLREALRDFRPRSSLPQFPRPDQITGEFELAIPLRRAVVVGSVGQPASVGGGWRLESLSLDRTPPTVQGEIANVAFDATVPVDRAVRLPGALVGRAPEIAAEDFLIDLAHRETSGALTPLGDDLANVMADGNDAVLQLPQASASFAEGRYLAVLTGRGAGANGSSIVQRSIHRLSIPSALGDPVALLAPPELTAPTAGTNAPVAGFEVQFAAPAGADWLEVELRSLAVGEPRVWSAVLPPEATSFEFRTFPGDFEVLAAGPYRLTVRARRVGSGPLDVFGEDRRYRAAIARLQSVGPDARGDLAVSERFIDLQLID